MKKEKETLCPEVEEDTTRICTCCFKEKEINAFELREIPRANRNGIRFTYTTRLRTCYECRKEKCRVYAREKKRKSSNLGQKKFGSWDFGFAFSSDIKNWH